MSNNYATQLQPNGSKILSVDTSGNSTTTITALSNVRLVASVDMFINFGTTASTTTSMFLPAYTPEYFQSVGVNIAAIVASGSGSLYITEMI